MLTPPSVAARISPAFRPAVGGVVLACALAILFAGAGAWGQGEPPGGEPAPTPSEAGGSDPGPDTERREVPPAPPPDEPRAPEPGDTVKFIFTSGDTVEAEVVGVEPDRYVVRIGGLEVDLRHSDIEDLIVLPSLAERFRQMRGLIEATDPDSMAALANWAFERGLHERALRVIDEAIAAAPNNAELREQRQLLSAQIELARERRRREAEREMEQLLDPEPEEPGGVSRMPRPYPDFPLLTEEQVNLIKVLEVNLKDPPRILIDRETIDILLSRYAENPLVPTTRVGRENFRRRRPAEILEVMFRLQARELYPQVRVLGHPESMRAFRDHVHAGWLTNNCSTNRCHGGEDAHGLILFNRRPTAARSFYTNFLILERYRTTGGRPLIDYASPEESLLLQMGLPPEEAITAHPQVEGWEPVFRDRNARGFRRAVRWIEMMYRPRPEHPIEYTPPGADVAEPEPAPEAEPVVR